MTISILIGVLAGLTVGFYEYFAYRANWWKYEPARVMVGRFCAWYIPLGELFMFLTVIPINGQGARPRRQTDGRRARKRCVVRAIAGGYGIAHVLLEVI